MAPWDSLIRFSVADGAEYWAALPLETVPSPGLTVQGHSSIEELESGAAGVKVTVNKLLAPVPETGIPIICIGLNYRNHANEASGELTLVLRNSIKNIKPSEAESHILGYTIGNDVTARFFQRSCGGQYTYAKGFDRFAPLGPRLVHPSLVDTSANGRITTKVNGRVVQNSPFDFIFPIDELLSFLSQGTTIPAGTAIMTGTPAGVGWFQDPKCQLQDGDIVEVEVSPIGVLKNPIVYEK
ncbi:hypothetical protein NEMBOFW57_003514 [Staphylotrichum longicolle]|uniref:Fumarylacetoacetase-like C-terminal domain-containing protein n=1 Tax=Staphylotrichum longicolle TaxID=669026 RepID=A0AAD4I5T2_9PEZI|nr:hypothetical protein NEMBOFW57_003514 [Staphylotrichum longicolle]